jgi:hypothetical protein
VLQLEKNMTKSKKPKHWYNVIATGTPEGDEEHKFFVALARNKKWTWRSVAALAVDAGLTETRVEEIIDKYEQMGLVFQHPTNENNWGYWECHPEMVAGEITSLAGDDQKDRIDGAITPDKVMKWGTPDPSNQKNIAVATNLVPFDQACKILETALDQQLVGDFMKSSSDCWSMPAIELNKTETFLGGHSILAVGYDPQMKLPFPPLMLDFGTKKIISSYLE